MPRKKTTSETKVKKKSSGAKKIKLKKATESTDAFSAHRRGGRLIDERLVGDQGDRFPVVMGFVAFVFLLAVVSVIGYYFLYAQTPDAEDFHPSQVVVPNLSVPSGESSTEVPVLDDDTAELAVVEVQQLRITDTPTGYLNVRTGPGTSFEKIDQLDPGGVYNILQYNQELGWYEIDLGDGGTGWVVKTYIELL